MYYYIESAQARTTEKGRPASDELAGRAACDKRGAFIHTIDMTRLNVQSCVDIVSDTQDAVKMQYMTSNVSDSELVDITPNMPPIVSPKEGVFNGTNSSK